VNPAAIAYFERLLAAGRDDDLPRIGPGNEMASVTAILAKCMISQHRRPI
jgi:hypothetical protein